ncbi:hypothetical protein [Aestuariivirga litoralis]|uniref:hypothetical protein n=1 Tax=Aestuariivirga litoralis TaxID=2650924 RepID=UPI0018C6037E|nr:hypothetical protein [Aestuariivirga litoralis]MBG1231744.1 hypothetical protein [Aestuariivirga litoralis]
MMGKLLNLLCLLLGLTVAIQLENNQLQFISIGNLAYISLVPFGLFCLRAIALLYDFTRYFRESRPVGRSDATVVKSVFESTKRYCEKYGILNSGSGSAIEIFAHPFLDRDLSDNGWNTGDVVIELEKEFFTSQGIVEKNKVVPGANNDKYFLRSFRHLFADDSEKLRLTLGRTDWVNLVNVKDKLMADEPLRHKIVKSDFKTKNAVPSSFCLHFVCLTKDNEFLALKRNNSTEYHPNAMSVSFEEQVARVDVERGSDFRAENWFQRAICEEVFPLTGFFEKNPAAAWDAVSQYVEFKRIWTGILEEDVGNFSLFGVMKINLSAAELVVKSRALEDEHKTKRDDEGRLYVFRKDDVLDYLQTGRARCRQLYWPEKFEDVTLMHPTSLYRAEWVMACLQA